MREEFTANQLRMSFCCSQKAFSPDIAELGISSPSILGGTFSGQKSTSNQAIDRPGCTTSRQYALVGELLDPGPTPFSQKEAQEHFKLGMTQRMVRPELILD
jgi:hypothetical protein